MLLGRLEQQNIHPAEAALYLGLQTYAERLRSDIKDLKGAVRCINEIGEGLSDDPEIETRRVFWLVGTLFSCLWMDQSLSEEEKMLCALMTACYVLGGGPLTTKKVMRPVLKGQTVLDIFVEMLPTEKLRSAFRGIVMATVDAVTLLKQMPPEGEDPVRDTAWDRVMAKMWRTAPEAVQRFVGQPTKVGRNDPCHCGSGKKYKKCHGGRN